MSGKKTILLLIILFIAASALLSLKWRSNTDIDKITVSGNHTISREEILSAARLNDSAFNTGEINIDIIQDRIQKHPEVKKVFVSRELPSELKIEIIEKRPLAILNSESEMKLVDDELDVFPYKNSSKLYDLPVISGVRFESSPDPKKRYNREDLRLGLFLIINSFRESRAMYNNISEINLSDTEKVIVYLTEDSCPFYFPRERNASISNPDYQQMLLNKLEVFESYIRQSLDNHLKESTNYVDLRFSNQVIVNFKN